MGKMVRAGAGIFEKLEQEPEPELSRQKWTGSATLYLTIIIIAQLILLFNIEQLPCKLWFETLDF
jgi:hypothetical protein